jgi:hypothetical protein
MFRRFLLHKAIGDKGLLLILPKPPLFPRLLLGTFVGNVNRNRSVPPSGANFAGKGLMIVKHVAIPGHLRMLVIHEGACCEPCGLLS